MRDRCPHCGADLTGAPIPEHERHFFGGAEFFLRQVALIADDRCVAYRCPDCNGEWGPEESGS